MIILNLFTEENQEEATIIKCHNIATLVENISKIKKEGVWVATENGENGEIIVTENINTIILAIKGCVFNLVWNSEQPFHLQLYSTYEDAYAVALHMKEPNPKCYN